MGEALFFHYGSWVIAPSERALKNYGFPVRTDSLKKMITYALDDELTGVQTASKVAETERLYATERNRS